MNKQAKFILPLVISGLLLTACVNDKPSSTSSVEPSNNMSSSIDDAFGSSTISFTPISTSSISVEPVLGIRSLKEGLQKIYGTKNYTIDVSLNFQPSAVFSVIFVNCFFDR